MPKMTVDQSDLDRISKLAKKYRKLDPQRLDNMIANCCQNLSNLALARAYHKLGLFKGVQVESKIRAKKYLARKG